MAEKEVHGCNQKSGNQQKMAVHPDSRSASCESIAHDKEQQALKPIDDLNNSMLNELHHPSQLIRIK